MDFECTSGKSLADIFTHWNSSEDDVDVFTVVVSGSSDRTIVMFLLLVAFIQPTVQRHYFRQSESRSVLQSYDDAGGLLFRFIF